MSFSDDYIDKTGRQSLHSIMPILNIPSVIRNGILCYNRALQIEHESVAMDEVQDRREGIRVPGGLFLHQYVNLYFDSRNPMLYLRRRIYERLCIMEIDVSILDETGIIMTDRNAASIAEFFDPGEGIQQIDFDKVFSRYWTHDSPSEYHNHKSVKCAEVLVPEKVDYGFVRGAIVGTESSGLWLRQVGFENPISVDSDAFFW